MTFTYGSVCSGIEAASVAWQRLGWQPEFFAEIEAFPKRVLAHHHPNVPNHGDITKFQTWPDHAIDLLVGGTPCQSFSVAGLRGGLDDPRGNLMLTFGAIAARYRPRWICWENVPGVFSSNEGRDFASLLGLLSGQRIDPPTDGWKNSGIVAGISSAYGLAWRVLDAQFVRSESHPFAVPQRRRRVFVVGYLGDWRRAAAVLFERESMRGDPAPRREAGKRPAGTLEARTGAGGAGWGTDWMIDRGVTAAPAAHALLAREKAGHSHSADIDTYIPEIVPRTSGTLQASGKAAGSATQQDAESDLLLAFGGNNQAGPIDVATACRAHHSMHQDFESETFVAHTLKAEGHDASEDGTGRRVPLVPSVAPCLTQNYAKQPDNSDTNAGPMLVPTAFRAAGQDGFTPSDISPPLAATDGGGAGVPTVAFNARQDPIHSTGASLPLDTDGTTQAIAFSCKDNGRDATAEVTPTLRGMGHDESHANGGGQLAIAIQERATSQNLDTIEDGRARIGPDGKGWKDDGTAYTVEARPQPQAVAFQTRIARNGRGQPEEICPALNGTDAGETSDMRPCVATKTAVRRLTPLECERLQGFPDNYTLIPSGLLLKLGIEPDPANPKHWAADGPRYKALGNSFAVNVVAWIGQRIQTLERLLSK